MGTIASQITSLTVVYSTVLFRRRWKKISKLHVTSLYAGNSPGTGEFPAQMASNAENDSIWWRHHVHLVLVNPLNKLCVREVANRCASQLLVRSILMKAFDQEDHQNEGCLSQIGHECSGYGITY